VCGINGFSFRDETLIEKMNTVTKHRGPDGHGVFFDDGISLGHNRLSIIDLSESAGQPMYSNDGRLVIVYNGELYNFKELKNELGDRDWKTTGDTEVILAAYEKWGVDCVKMFNGIFSFAIWDRVKKELFVARDFAGVKPFYYSLHSGNFIFSSEIKAILEHGVSRKMDTKSFDAYMRINYVPAPDTMFVSVKKLPIGHYGIWKDGDFRIAPYLNSVSGKRDRCSYREAVDRVEMAVDSAVQRQLISDRPVGVFLSGGLDSTIVLDSMCRHRGAVDTFSIGFVVADSTEGHKFNDDMNLARETARHYDTNHHELYIDGKYAAEHIARVAWHLDEPFYNPTTISTYALSEFTKKTCDVALGGDGGDELFGGYPRYRLSRMLDYYHLIPQALRTILGKVGRMGRFDTPYSVDRFLLFMAKKDNEIERVVNSEFVSKGILRGSLEERYFKNIRCGSVTENLMNIDRISWLVDESLVRTDKLSMAHGLEQRVPLLDKELIELGESLPLSFKLRGGVTKRVLRDAFRGRIPGVIMDQPKRGWMSPGSYWLRNTHFRLLADEVLTPTYYGGTSRLFDWDRVRAEFDEHVNGGYHMYMLWTILMFQVWAREYKVEV
jgi:asparagine synthase (glutamine-hydrolysing)